MFQPPLLRAALGKAFAESKAGFAESPWPSAKKSVPVVILCHEVHHMLLYLYTFEFAST
jgi:hypothetical protein